MEVVRSIREFNSAIPFEPYDICLASGERLRIPHPDFVSISPKNSLVVAFDARGRPHHLNVVLIERAVRVGT